MNFEYEIIEFDETLKEYVVIFTDPDGKVRRINVPAVIDPIQNRVLKVETTSQIENHIRNLFTEKLPLTAAQDLVGRKGNTQRKTF